VVEWYRGTGLRPVLAALDPGHAGRFLAEYSERVTKAYPAAPYGTVLPFRRVFVVAQVR
jgi:trans-aconitate 2-methyltransferase